MRTYWKSMALKDSHSPAAASVISGSSMIGEYAHAAVAVTADGVPIVSSNFWVPIEDSCVPVSSLTLAQLHRLGGFDNPGGEVKSLQDFVDIAGGNKSRILTLKEALSVFEKFSALTCPASSRKRWTEFASLVPDEIRA